MKDIAIFIPTIKSGGAEKQAALLAKNLSRCYTVHFVVYYGDYPHSIVNESILNKGKHISIYYLEGNHVKKTFQMSSILKRNGVSAVFNYLTFCDCWCSIVQKMSGVRYIYNGIRNSRLPIAKLLMEKWIHNYLVTGTIFNCYSGTEYFTSKGFKPNKCITIHNCFSEISEPISRESDSPVKVVTVGRFVPQKDYETAIRVMSTLREKSITYSIIGYGELENTIRDWIDKYDMKEKIKLIINPSNTQDILRNADIYLSTSLFEGTSNSIMEAMNWSIPVVATNVGDNQYLVNDGKNGYIHNTGDFKGLVKSLEILINDHKLRNKMGREGNRMLRNKFSEQLFEKKYRDIVEKEC